MWGKAFDRAAGTSAAPVLGRVAFSPFPGSFSVLWPALGAVDVSDALWTVAEADLTVRLPGAPADAFVWEHSQRVVRMMELISALPELTSQPVDRAALRAAGLYHDVGWVLQVQEGHLAARDVLLRPTTDIQRELAADFLTQRCASILSGDTLQRAARAIRQYNDRRTDVVEARILSDADNLDQIGPQAIHFMMRKVAAEGRTLAELVSAWRRQEEYHYWQARIKECFHFPAVRELAELRYERMRDCMAKLCVAVMLEDLAAAGNGKAVRMRG